MKWAQSKLKWSQAFLKKLRTDFWTLGLGASLPFLLDSSDLRFFACGTKFQTFETNSQECVRPTQVEGIARGVLFGSNRSIQFLLPLSLYA